MNMDIERKKPFSVLEKDLFLNIIQKYEAILSSKKTNPTSALKRKSTWETIKEEFNTSAIVTQQASTKQLIKLWYNMKAKARETKTKENDRHLIGGVPSVTDMNPMDARVIDIDRSILTNIEVEVCDIDGSVFFEGDCKNEASNKPNNNINATEQTKEAENNINKSPSKHSNIRERMNRVDLLKCKLLEEELEYKKKIHDVDYKMKIFEAECKEKQNKLELEMLELDHRMKVSERQFKEKLQNIELEIKSRYLLAMNK